MNSPESTRVVMTLTDELFLPSRVIYRVFDSAALESKFKKLRSMQWDAPNRRWTWLYQHEARKAGFPSAYDAVPEERQPIVLASCYMVQKEILQVYLRSTERLVRWLAFMDKHISRNCAKGEFFDEYNQVTVVKELTDPPKPEDFFREESRIEFVDAEEAFKAAGSPGEYFSRIQDSTLPKLERHRLESFYEDGIESFEQTMRFRQAIVMKQHQTGRPVKPYEFIQNLLGGTPGVFANPMNTNPAPEGNQREIFHLLDDKMQQGYKTLEARKLKETCEIWREAWGLALKIAEAKGFQTFEEFDKTFSGAQFVFNWIQDFEMEMGNLALEDPIWHQRRIQVCEEALTRFPKDAQIAGNFRQAIAETWTLLGDRSRSDSMYETWLKEKPTWGWGWIGWSDCYNFCPGMKQDLARAEELLKRGLAAANVVDREDILDRLASLYEDQGRTAEAKGIRAEEAKLRIPVVSLEQPFSLVHPGKIGRNDPCPCGSGRKFKKCCGG